MRTLGEFKELKQAVVDKVLTHPKMLALMASDPFRGKWPNPAELKIHCHWDQSLSLELTETVLGNDLVGPNHLKQIITEAIPSAHIYGAETKRAMSDAVLRTSVHFSIPEEAAAVPTAVPTASNF